MAADMLFWEIQATGNKNTRNFFRITSVLFLLALAVNLMIQKGKITDLTTGFFAGLLLLLLGAFITGVRMETQFRKDGIYVRYPPFQPRFSHFAWTEINRIHIRNYNALAEYNGWGIKTGISGRSFTAGGNMGIQLELNDGTFVLIGTRKPQDAEKAIQQIQMS